MLALIDGDVIKYACGFASDANAKANGVEREDLSFCLQGVHETIKSILRASGATDYVTFLSHPVNRRETIYPEYKANRDPTHKPKWFKEIHDYLMAHHYGTYSEEGDEADDAMGMIQCTSDFPTIICSIDKDLDGIPGLHYNFHKNKKARGVYFVDEVEADRWFYKQILTGDSSDNIPGMYRILGVKASSRYTKPLDSLTDPSDMFSHVVDCYRGDVDKVKWLGDLLWIKRDEKGIWLPK